MPKRHRLIAYCGSRAGWDGSEKGFLDEKSQEGFGVSHSIIQRLQERFRTTGSAGERPRSGRPRITMNRGLNPLCVHTVYQLRNPSEGETHVMKSRRTSRFTLPCAHHFV